MARNHRLWETYLILHADIAPNHVDRDADLIEHVLEPDLVSQLLETVSARYPQMEMPPSPHPLEPGTLFPTPSCLQPLTSSPPASVG